MLHVRDKDKTLWQITKDFITNEVEVGEIFSRKSMFCYAYPETHAQKNKGKIHTIDNYRALLTKVEIITATRKPGMYKKLREIPTDLSLGRVRKIASDHSWKRWFIPMEERI